jgi:hypothetical protein
MKKFLWFLVGMALIISVPVLLFNGESPPKGAAPQEANPKGVTTHEANQKEMPKQEVTTQGTASKESPPKGIETRKDQAQKPGAVSEKPIKGVPGK